MVVKPDMASKKASLRGMGLEHVRNGIIPNIENITHTIAVSRKPSRLPVMMDRGLDSIVRMLPVIPVAIAVKKKHRQSDSR